MQPLRIPPNTNPFSIITTISQQYYILKYTNTCSDFVLLQRSSSCITVLTGFVRRRCDSQRE
jgi:hypothetical protein